ncbi:MAG: hypothetical protein K0R54_5007, partial [Clostridiaceae bacterium]|nr:hypothetical protein [Clostridiaceae bacterium]
RKEDIKDSLLPILQDLLSEYMAIKPEKNNVMTRQNILKMITDLYQVIYKDENKVTLNDVLEDISHVWNGKKDFDILNPIDNAIVCLEYIKNTADSGHTIGSSLKSILEKVEKE